MWKTLIQWLMDAVAPRQKKLKSSKAIVPKAKEKAKLNKVEEPMYKYSKKSLDKLKTCHPDIQRLMKEAIKYIDLTIIEGVRSVEQQEEYVRTGKSKTMNSKHLKQPDGYSHAIDVMAYPIRWNDWKRNAYVAGFLVGLAKQMGIELVSGIDWDKDFDVSEHSFLDAPHFELDK